MGREEGRREGGGLFKGVPGRRRRRGAEGATRGKKLWAAFRRASPDDPLGHHAAPGAAVCRVDCAQEPTSGVE